MIAVIGRPGIAASGELTGPAAQISLAAAASGARVEVAGTVGDDEAGDRVAVALAQGGVGHAALLRITGARTPGAVDATGALPRLDAQDVDLALRYLIDIAVVVVADRLSPEADAVVREAAQYHGAELVRVDPSDDPVVIGQRVAAAAGTAPR